MLVWCGARGIPLYGPSGASAHLRGIARALAHEGHAVRVATPLAADARGGWDAEPLHGVHGGGRRFPRGLRRIGARLEDLARWRAAVRDFPVDQVWERHDGVTTAPTLARRLVELNAPLAWERRWPAPPRTGELRREMRRLRTADVVLAVSTWLARWAVDEAGCVPERVRYVPNGVDVRPLGDRARGRATYGLNGQVIGFVGSLHRWQGARRIPAMLDALGADWSAVVVGSGDHAPRPHPRLVRTGHLDAHALPDVLAAVDVAIAPYEADGPPWFSPLKLALYRAHGVPIVASETGDAARVVGEGGEVLSDDDPRAWADAIVRQASCPRIVQARSWRAVVKEALSP